MAFEFEGEFRRSSEVYRGQLGLKLAAQDITDRLVSVVECLGRCIGGQACRRHLLKKALHPDPIRTSFQREQSILGPWRLQENFEVTRLYNVLYMPASSDSWRRADP